MIIVHPPYPLKFTVNELQVCNHVTESGHMSIFCVRGTSRIPITLKSKHEYYRVVYKLILCQWLIQTANTGNAIVTTNLFAHFYEPSDLSVVVSSYYITIHAASEAWSIDTSLIIDCHRLQHELWWRPFPFPFPFPNFQFLVSHFPVPSFSTTQIYSPLVVYFLL